MEALVLSRFAHWIVERFGTLKRALYDDGRPGALMRALNRLDALTYASGLLAPRHGATLEVIGRRSGRPVSLPVAVVELDGSRFLVSMLGPDANWVRNVRAADGRAVLRRRGREPVVLDEVPEGERPPVLRRYLAIAPGARPHLPVDWRAPLPEFVPIAHRYPVFRINGRHDGTTQPAATEHGARERQSNVKGETMSVRSHVIIVGAGFGGLAVARGLEHRPVDVTLIDRNNFTTFQPLLYQVATAGLNAADVAAPVRGLFHRQPNLRVLQGEVIGVDWDRRQVLIADHRPVRFDHLVLAVGAVNSWFAVPGAAQLALPLYTLQDALKVRNHVVSRFEAADADPSLIQRGALNFVVVGGGPTGVEMAGALAELFAVVFKRDYQTLPVGRARVVLVESRDRLLPRCHTASQRRALDALQARQVEVRLGDTVEEVTADHVRLASGETISTNTVIWAAGVRAHPVAEAIGLLTTRAGRVEVAPDLSVPGHEGVWAVGDVAAPMARGGDVLPQLAPVAMQTGAHVARQIGRLSEGKPTRPFRFLDKGTMATVGRRSAVAELPGRIRLGGTIAWLAWLALHIVYLAGLRNRASVLLNWAWGYLTWDRGPRIILRSDTGATDEAGTVDDATTPSPARTASSK